MFLFDQFVDAVQEGKKYFVNSFVSDSKLKMELNTFIDKQTAFTKQAFATTQTVIEKGTDEVLKFTKK